MEALQIILANGDVAQAGSLQSYFAHLFEAEESGRAFPVSLEHVWRIGYSRKDAAVRALQSKFTEGVDYQSFHRIVERENGATTEEVFDLTVSCMEWFTVRNNREVFEVYISCRKAVKALIKPVLPDFSNEVAAARAWADEREARQLAEKSVAAHLAQIAADAPKVEFANAVAVAGNCLSMSKTAKALKIPGVGRTKLFEMLRRDRILMASNEPYANHIQHIQVEVQTFQTNSGVRVTITPRVTPAGLDYLQKRYKPAPTTTALTIAG